jgi:hypothetical protein
MHHFVGYPLISNDSKGSNVTQQKNGPDLVVYVPIFAKDYHRVLRFLSDLEQVDGRAQSNEVAGRAEAFLWGPGRLADLHGVAKPMQCALLTRIAEAGLRGEPVSYEDLRGTLETVTGKPATYDHVRGNLAWISKYGKSIRGTPAGPFEITDLGPGRSKGDRYEYVMSQEDAEAWLDIERRHPKPVR